MPFGPLRYSIERSFPAVVSLLLGSVVAVLTWASYREVHGVVVEAADTRLTTVTRQLAELFAQSFRQRLDSLRAVAGGGELQRALATGRDADLGAAGNALERVVRGLATPSAAFLLDRDGRIVARSGAEPLVATPPDPGLVPAVGPFRALSDTVLYHDLRLPLISATDTVGVLVHRRQQSTSAAGAQALRNLVGTEAVLLLGNRAGDVWLDFERAIAAPDARFLEGRTRTVIQGGIPHRGAAVEVPGSPLVAVVAFAEAQVLGPARRYRVRVLSAALVVTVLGAAAAWWVSRRLTRPIRQLATAAGEVALGRYPEVVVERQDELGRLAAVFNAMGECVRTQMEDLRASEARYREVVEQATYGILRSTPDGRVLMANPALVRMLGYENEAEVRGRILDRDVYVDPQARREAVQRQLAGLSQDAVETRWRRKDGGEITVEITAQPIRDADGRIVAVEKLVKDVTTRAQLREQLLHAQRMDSVGRLAGGIAHDFNNILTAIVANADLALGQLPPSSPLERELVDIRDAGMKAADLTRQLLAVSRKQLLEPQIVGLNDLVGEIERLFERVVGEDIRLATNLAPDLHPVYADPGQLHQVLLNLVVNARDAMPTGGLLTISTQNVALDETYAEEHLNVAPGQYVMVAVTDTGTGMSPDVQARLFEPFFTTKPKGKGTGLGLSTVYGIVKQSGGHIWVYSEPGRGSTFKVYLPASLEAPAPVPALEVGAHRGTELVLLVEDDPRVRSVAGRILEANGYHVLEAEDGAAARRQLEEHGGRVELVLTDVVMPEEGGPNLVEWVRRRYPTLPILYMSGYTDDTMAHHGVLGSGVPFIQKPFTPSALARKVRDVLGGRPPA